MARIGAQPTIQDYARARLASTDFVEFCRFVHDVELARHMQVWVKVLESDHPSNKKVAIAAPPESWKSRTLRMWIEYSIGRNPEWARCLAMNTADQAWKQVQSVEDTIEYNRAYNLTFPHVKPH